MYMRCEVCCGERERENERERDTFSTQLGLLCRNRFAVWVVIGSVDSLASTVRELVVAGSEDTSIGVTSASGPLLSILVSLSRPSSSHVYRIGSW